MKLSGQRTNKNKEPVGLTCLTLISGNQSIEEDPGPEYLVGAYHAIREKHSGPGSVSHHAIVVKTNLGNYYLIHSLAIVGNTMRKAILSAKWEIIGPLYIKDAEKRKITLDELLHEGSGFGSGYVNYLSAGFCFGTFYKMKFFLYFGYSFNKVLFWFLFIVLCLIIFIFFIVEWKRKEKERRKREAV